jgi:hypothetical protein
MPAVRVSSIIPCYLHLVNNGPRSERNKNINSLEDYVYDWLNK